MCDAELAELKATGALGTVAHSADGKYFATTCDDAHTWGRMLHGDAYHIIGACFPAHIREPLWQARVDGVGDAVFAEQEALASATICFGVCP